MYPVFSKLSEHSQTELKIAVEKSLNFLLLCDIPISTGLMVAAPNIVGFLYHRSDFINTIPVMQYLAPGLLFLYINSVLTSVLVSMGHEKKIPLMAGIALVFNLGLNLLLIPLYQQVGAALVTSLTELLLTILALVFVPRSLWPLGSIKVGLKALLAGLVMGLVVWFMQRYSLLAILPVAALVYFGTATLLGTIPRDDMKALYASVRSKAGHTKASIESGEITLEDAPFVTEENMPLLAGKGTQQEQEFLLLLSREMTRGLPPLSNSDRQLPDAHCPSDEEVGIAASGKVFPIRGRKTRQIYRFDDDDDITDIHKVVRPRKSKKTRDLSR
jgi:Polysaccharide biosynthesis C-terminal domain